MTSSDGPRALVVVPTRELGRQVHDVAKSLCKTQPLRVALFTGSHTLRAQKKMVQEVSGRRAGE